MTQVKGRNGQISFDGHVVQIRRGWIKAALMGVERGTRSIPLRSIAAVRLKKRSLGFGALVIEHSGTLDNMSRSSRNLHKNPDAVTFSSNRAAQGMQALVDEINEALES